MKRNRFLIIMFIIGIVVLSFVVLLVINSNAMKDNKTSKNNQENTQVSETKSESKKDKTDEKKENTKQEVDESEPVIPSTNNSDKNTDTNVTQPVQNVQPNNNTGTNPKENNERQCVVKKFYSVFRADFDNFNECNEKGNELKEKNDYYGFTCDYQTDDCGDIYYMLTFFDGNGNFIDYPSVPKS